MSRRVLVTGATGLIGRQLPPVLTAAGYEVAAVPRRDRPIPGAAQVIAGNLLDPDDRQRVLDAARAQDLVHLAWHDAPQGRWQAAENLDWVAATLHLVRGFAAQGGKRAVCVGSCAEYDWTADRLSETDTPLRPASLYGHAKAATGTLLAAAAPRLGLSLAWARVFFCYGPGEPEGRLLGDLIAGLMAGRAVDCTDGLQERDFLHTADIAAALTALLKSDLDGPVNIASGTAVPVRALIETTASLMGHPDLVRLGARPRPASDPSRLAADVARLAGTGFRPRFDLRSGLADCVAQARAQERARAQA